jgi:hypothetical protein
LVNERSGLVGAVFCGCCLDFGADLGEPVGVCCQVAEDPGGIYAAVEEAGEEGADDELGFLLGMGVMRGEGVTDLDDSAHVITLIDEKLERIITLVAGFLSL